MSADWLEFIYFIINRLYKNVYLYNCCYVVMHISYGSKDLTLNLFLELDTIHVFIVYHRVPMFCRTTSFLC